MYFDTHTHHCPFSHDGHQSLDQLVDTAVSNGLDGVLLTDHYDVDFPSAGLMADTFDIDEGMAEWRQFRETHRPDCPIAVRYGIEIGYQPHLTDLCRSMIDSGRFDGVILSLHLLNGVDPFFDDSVYSAGKRAAYTAYLDAYVNLMAAVPGPAIIGHYDYIARYAIFEDNAMRYAEMPDAFDRFFNALIESGKCLEFNVRSRRRKVRTDPMTGFFAPDPEIYRRYVELGGRLVSLGSDAHSPGETGQWFTESAAFLRDCGVRELTHFESGQPCLTPIRF